MNSLYKIFSIIAQWLYNGTIVGKQIYGSKKKLYYDRGQHLIFFLRPSIKYEFKIQNSIKPFIKNGACVFDIGANIGQYTLLFSELVGENGMVYSFEPDIKNYSFLNFNKTINKCKNVLCCNIGVGREDCESSFFCDSATGGRLSSFIKSNVGSNFKGIEFQTKISKLDSLIHIYGVPDFVKIDVEGFELDVILGLSKDLIDTIWLIEVRENTKKSVFEYFEKRGYECRHCEHAMNLISDATQIPGFANLVFKKAQPNSQ
jgi:FkbM family methyltransferase